MSSARASAFLKPAAPLLLIGLWACTSSLIPSWPGPVRVLGLLLQYLQQPDFQTALAGSVRRMAIGYAFVAVLGVGIGLLLGRITFLDQLVGSLAVAANAIPGAAWVPLAVLWFGLTEKAVIFTIVLGAVGIVAVNTDTGIREVPPLLSRAARTMGAKGAKYFWFVVVPAAIPKMVNGLRLAWAFGWRALMAGELITSISGLGQLLSQVAKARQLDHLLALMLLIALIGAAVDGLIFKRVEHEVRVRWGLVP